jgi:hypothetical protein
MLEFDTHFAAALLVGTQVDHAADQFLLGFRVPEGEQIAGLNRHFEREQRPMRADNERACFFGDRVSSRRALKHNDADAQTDALAAAEIGHFNEMWLREAHEDKPLLRLYRQVRPQTLGPGRRLGLDFWQAGTEAPLKGAAEKLQPVEGSNGRRATCPPVRWRLAENEVYARAPRF